MHFYTTSPKRKTIHSDGFSFCFPLVSINNISIRNYTSHRLSGRFVNRPYGRGRRGRLLFGEGEMSAWPTEGYGAVITDPYEISKGYVVGKGLCAFPQVEAKLTVAHRGALPLVVVKDAKHYSRSNTSVLFYICSCVIISIERIRR